MVRPEKGEEVGHGAFQVTIKGKNNTFEKKVSIALEPYGAKKETKKRHIVRKLARRSASDRNCAA